MYYPDVPALEPDELNLLCNEYLEHNATLDPHLADQMGVKRGLRNLDGTGVLAGITNVSNVIGYDKRPDGTIAPIPGRLVYRGIDIDTLAAEADAHDRFMFEEVIWLLLFGSLPTQEQYAKFRKLLEHHRELPQGFADDMILNSPSPNLMNKMARSVLAMYSYDEHAEDNSLPNILRQSINLIAELPTMMVNAYQIKRRVYDRSSMYFHLPTEGQSTAEHILSTYRADQKFTHEEARLLDLHLPRAVQLRHGYIRGDFVGHRRAEGPQARRRKPEGHAPAGLHSRKCRESDKRRRGPRAPAQDPPQGARRRQRLDLRHGPRSLHLE